MTADERRRSPNGASTIYLGKDGYWHGRVTVGVRDNGSPDRRHVMGTRADVTRKVRALEKQRDGGTVRKTGRTWTVEQWLTHWLENIAAPFVRENTFAGYRVAVNVHLVPGLGKHRLDIASRAGGLILNGERRASPGGPSRRCAWWGWR